MTDPKYVMNVSSPVVIPFFCEQQSRIVLIDQHERQEFIDKLNPSKVQAAVPDEGCGMGRCEYFDLLGHQIGVISGHCSLAFQEDKSLSEAEQAQFCANERKEKERERKSLMEDGIFTNDPGQRQGCRETEEPEFGDDGAVSA